MALRSTGMRRASGLRCRKIWRRRSSGYSIFAGLVFRIGEKTGRVFSTVVSHTGRGTTPASMRRFTDCVKGLPRPMAQRSLAGGGMGPRRSGCTGSRDRAVMPYFKRRKSSRLLLLQTNRYGGAIRPSLQI